MASHQVTDQRKVYLKLRKKHKEAFDLSLCNRTGELNKLFAYVCKSRKDRNMKDELHQELKKIGNQPHNLDYDELLSLIPDIPEFSKDDLEPNSMFEARKHDEI